MLYRDDFPDFNDADPLDVFGAEHACFFAGLISGLLLSVPLWTVIGCLAWAVLA